MRNQWEMAAEVKSFYQIKSSERLTERKKRGGWGRPRRGLGDMKHPPARCKQALVLKGVLTPLGGPNRKD